MISQFSICNLLAYAFGILCELIFLSVISLFVSSDFIYYFLRSLFMALFLPFAMYFVCFRKDRKLKDLCMGNDGFFEKTNLIVKRYFKAKAKFIAVLLLFSVLLLMVSSEIWIATSADMANALDLSFDTVKLLLSSASCFVEYLPMLAFGKDLWYLRLAGAFLWCVYFVLSYYLSMLFTVKSWRKHGFENSRKINIKNILKVSGIVLQLEYWLYFALILFSENQSEAEDSTGWFRVLTSLLLIVVFEIVYLIEAIWSVSENRSKFNVFKLCTVIVVGYLLTGGMYYGTVQTIICNVLLVFLAVTECIALSKDTVKRKSDFVNKM